MKKRLFAIFFLVVMATLGVASVVGYVKTHVPEENDDIVFVPMTTSFTQQYPFEREEVTEATAKIDESAMVAEIGSAAVSAETDSDWLLDAVKGYTSKVNHAVSGVNINTCNLNPLSAFVSSVVSFLDRYDTEEIFYNGGCPFVRLPNGYFTFLYPYSHPDESMNNLVEFTDWLKPCGVKYLSLIAADKGDDEYAVFPEGVPHGYSRIAKEYREFNREHGIEFLESKESLLANNSDFFYWFYKTDHHWNAHAGLLVARETARKLLTMGVEADTSAIAREKFSMVCYPKGFLGSMGYKLGSKYKEDMDVYYPLGESRFHLQIPSRGIDRTDSFDNTLILKQYLLSEKLSYGAFLHGDNPLTRIENMLSPNSTRVLMIKQSKANVLCPYLAFTVRYLDVIDPRKFDGSIRSFIKQTRPDIVITCNDVMYEGSEELWRLK